MTGKLKEKTREYFGFGTKRMKALKVCGICGTAVSADKRFCTNCKAKLPHKTVYDIYKSNHRVCEKCSAVLPENAAYCPQCGEKQSKPPKAYKTADNKIAL